MVRVESSGLIQSARVMVRGWRIAAQALPPQSRVNRPCTLIYTLIIILYGIINCGKHPRLSFPLEKDTGRWFTLAVTNGGKCDKCDVISLAAIILLIHSH